MERRVQALDMKEGLAQSGRQPFLQGRKASATCFLIFFEGKGEREGGREGDSSNHGMLYFTAYLLLTIDTLSPDHPR